MNGEQCIFFHLILSFHYEISDNYMIQVLKNSYFLHSNNSSKLTAACGEITA
jgi:hypothetical protein